MTTQTEMRDGWAEVRGLRLHYEDWGNPDRPAVVILHGLRGSALNYEDVSRELANAYRVIALDQRGRGLSDWAPDADYSAEAQANVLADFAEKIGIRRFALIGHSLGGAAAIAFAAGHASQLWGLVLEDPAVRVPGLPAGGFERVPAELGAAPATFPSWHVAREYRRGLLPDSSDEQLEAGIRAALKEKPDGTVTWKYDLEGLRRAVEAGLGTDRVWKLVARLAPPTLLVHGANSDVVPASAVTALRKENPLIEAVEISDAAHLVHIDNLTDFSKAVTGFLARHTL